MVEGTEIDRTVHIYKENAMEWEKPEFVEISLACEISSYANAELSEAPAQPATRTINE